MSTTPSSGSTALRNPFRGRSDTFESMHALATDPTRTTADSSDASLVHRSVPTYLPKRSEGPPTVQPLKAVFFTQQGVPSNDQEVHLDESASDESALSSPATPMTATTLATPTTPVSPPTPVAASAFFSPRKRTQLGRRHSTVGAFLF